ncbi:hypothetical protein P7K49_013475 [Saguinus oedipus]|uniref:Uncharacterized protein n=1 Tax=Saguinus oedipus TaxID=9490 RepID=A0ABQ9VGJ5_SAGOE|nr:hypothetical protein P7K49_013475 [Saguinus oedipus]
MSDAAVDTSSEITTKVRLDAARPLGVRAPPPGRCLERNSWTASSSLLVPLAVKQLAPGAARRLALLSKLICEPSEWRREEKGLAGGRRPAGRTEITLKLERVGNRKCWGARVGARAGRGKWL